MKTRKTLFAAITVVLAVGVIVGFWTTAGGAIVTLQKKADHSLFDQTGGDLGASCRGNGPFGFQVAVRAIDGDAVMRVKFQDGDFIDYPVADNSSFSLVQAAGDTQGVDRRLDVVSAPSSVGKLVGWVSAYRLPSTDTLVACRTLT